MFGSCRTRPLLAAALMTLAAAAGAPLGAQVRTIDPNQAIDADLRTPRKPAAVPRTAAPPATQAGADFQRYPDEPVSSQTSAQQYPAQQYPAQQYPAAPPAGAPAGAPYGTPASTTPPSYTPPPYTPPLDTPQDVARDAADAKAATAETFQRQELLRAAEGTFGKGASGLAGILERTLKEQGLPNAYIAGREAAGAVVVGLRYGKGTMFHKVEGEKPVYWTGPSLGFDLGGDATKVFVLVYNLYDSEDLYRRFPAAEGRLYFVGGFAATYLRRGNVVLIPIRLGIGWRQGVNVGYMKFSHKSRWFPF